MAKHEWYEMPVEDTPFGKMGGNSVLENDKVKISYQPHENGTEDNLINQLGEALGVESRKGPETALYNYKEDIWYIIEGDCRKEYVAVLPDWNKCIEFYESKKAKYRLDWSTD